MSRPPDLGADSSAAKTGRHAARHALAPPAQVTARQQGRRAALLALIAGYVDAYAFVKYRLYVSFMSGNTTQTASQAGQAQFADARHSLFPIPCFVIGVFVGTILANAPSVIHRAWSWESSRLCWLSASALVCSQRFPIG